MLAVADDLLLLVEMVPPVCIHLLEPIEDADDSDGPARSGIGVTCSFISVCVHQLAGDVEELVDFSLGDGGPLLLRPLHRC